MEGGGAAAQREREPRLGDVVEEGRKAGAGRQPSPGGGGMKFRVSARAPHGVGALLLIGGAVVAGAAAVAWRHARRARQPAAKQEALDDGGVVEDGKGGAEIHRPDDDLTLLGKEKTETGSNGLDDARVTQEIQEVHEDAEKIQEVHGDAETVADESFQNGGLVEKFGLDPKSSPTEISVDDGVDSEQVEKFHQDSSTNLSDEITEHDMGSETVEKSDDEISVKDDAENDHSSTKNDDTENDQDGITSGSENENSSTNELKQEIAPDDTEEVKACDQCPHSISRPGIILHEQSLHGDSAQEAESMENSPTSQLVMHQEQLLDDMTMDTEGGEAAEAKPGEGRVLDKDVPSRLTQPVGLVGSPALPSLVVKPAEKKEPELRGRFETGMKIEQDYTIGGGMKEGGLVAKGRRTAGESVTTVDRRSSRMAILALMLALTIGITVAVRLYALPTATKLRMGFP